MVCTLSSVYIVFFAVPSGSFVYDMDIKIPYWSPSQVKLLKNIFLNLIINYFIYFH